MNRRFVAIASLAGLIAIAAPSYAQQPGLRPLASGTLFQFTPYAGYMAFGNFLKGPIGTTLSMKNGPVYGAQIGMKITPNLSVIGNVAYSSTNLQVGVPFLGGINAGNAGVWLYDGGLQLDIPTGGSSGRSPITPFVQVGAGAMTYNVSAANLLNTNATNFAFNAGAGIDYQVAPTIGIRLMAKDYVGKFNFKDATSFDIQGRTTQNWALTAGVKIGF